jgi:uncharacterized glyoxalase superfamily protein PhnB
MLSNRSMPRARVIPELAYPDVGEAADWLCAAFGFKVRLRIANHRAQLNVDDDGAIVVTERSSEPGDVGTAHSVMVRVEDVDTHYVRATEHGAIVIRPPVEYPYGEKQYTVRDFGGHYWTFSESVADVDPRTWGGVPGEP